jgi:hypothetical protein
MNRCMMGAAMGLMMLAAFSMTNADETQATQPASTGQHPQQFEATITFKLNYLLFLPESYGNDPDKKWPLIFFLHGSGERGNNVDMVKRHGPPKIVETQKDFPFIVVSPQCPPDTGWKPIELNLLLDQILAKYHVDLPRGIGPARTPTDSPRSRRCAAGETHRWCTGSRICRFGYSTAMPIRWCRLPRARKWLRRFRSSERT